MANSEVFWMVRAGERGYMLSTFIEKGIIAIGWKELGNLSKIKNRQQIKDLLKKGYPDLSNPQINNSAAQIAKFRFEFVIGHKILSYNAVERIYWIGEVKSNYKYDSKAKEYPHYREIKWMKSVSRDLLSPSAKNSLGSTLTIFNVAPEIIQELTRQEIFDESLDIAALEAEAEELALLLGEKEDIESRAREFIKDKFMKLDAYQFQDLIAGILRAMGYKTLVSSKGPDKGKDILASPDGLGLNSPRIKVEVKHHKGKHDKMGSKEIRGLLGGMRSGDTGIFVSTSGFTNDAKYEGERSTFPMTLIDSELLADLIIQNYDQFDPETRSLIPLKKIYWPI